jgi:hypothetical protein
MVGWLGDRLLAYARPVPGFVAVIKEAPNGGAYVEVPEDVVAALGGKGRIPVDATFDGVAYRGSIVSMGGEKILGVLKSVRSTLGKSAGDEVTVAIHLDDAERSVTLPDDLAVVLASEGLGETFMALSYSHQREYVTWICEAKQSATRAKRVRQTIERLQR